MEGIVIKVREFIPVRNGFSSLRIQPAVKVRGREYLRVIYGPEYTDPQHLSRLRERGLTGKRSLALREFALGVEGLERFVRKEPLRRVHECLCNPCPGIGAGRPTIIGAKPRGLERRL